MHSGHMLLEGKWPDHVRVNMDETRDGGKPGDRRVECTGRIPKF
jgi:hypothetical protein